MPNREGSKGEPSATVRVYARLHLRGLLLEAFSMHIRYR